MGQANEGFSTLLTHMSCFSAVNFSVIEKSRRLLKHISTWQTSKGFYLSKSSLVTKESKDAQEGLPAITAIASHLFTTVVLVWARRYALSLFIQTLSTVHGLVQEEPRAVQEVHSFPAYTWCS